MPLTKLDDIPPVLHEESLHPFKFCFGEAIQEGLSYRNELFCRLYSVDETRRAQLYHYGCQLARQEAVLITVKQSTYSLWIGLRSPKAAFCIAEKASGKDFTLPHLEAAPQPIVEIDAERTPISLNPSPASEYQV
ncbi:hypothetical protein [Leptolyngbya ohadii]|uniref:hypothetical protein n=1 Tax=Leptolyngbya ohadii TaxID=1962290 RepID=UPI000B59FF81|nr:hypothetical protein [Leptolyngbya ohadii]